MYKMQRISYEPGWVIDVNELISSIKNEVDYSEIPNPVVMILFGDADWYGFFNSPQFEKFVEKECGTVIEVINKRGVEPPKDVPFIYNNGKDTVIWVNYGTYGGKMRLGDHYLTRVIIINEDCAYFLATKLKQASTIYTIQILKLYE